MHRPNERPGPSPRPSARIRGLAAAAAKRAGWTLLALAVRAAQAVAGLAGRARRVDTIVYKVDRLGDWLLAEGGIAAIAADCRARDAGLVIWASRETAALRAWRPVPCPVETIVFEPAGWRARLRRALSLLRLLAIYRTDNLICLRHGNDPIRELVLRTCAARRVFACTWVLAPGAADVVPHELRRHWRILQNAGLAPEKPGALLPRLERSTATDPARIVVAPFSSAAVKEWPAASWAELAAGFSAGLSWELWIGPGQERAAHSLAQAARAAAPHLSVSVRSGSLRELAAAIASARLVLSVDTLAAHLAAAFDVPLVALLGGGQPGDFAPWSRSSRQRWLEHPLPCFHCNWRCHRPQNDCVRLITPSEVLEAATALLATTAVGSPAASARPGASLSTA